MKKIILLDSNPYKVKEYGAWFKKIKPAKTFFQPKIEILRAGLKETYENILLFEEKNTYTIYEALEEICRFNQVIKSKYDYFKLNQKINGRIRGNAKKNKELLDLIMKGRDEITKYAKESLYYPEEHRGFETIYKITKLQSEEVAKKRKKDYSETDTKLATTGLVRSYNGLETEIKTPDGDIEKIIKNTSDYILLNNIDIDIYNFPEFKGRINVIEIGDINLKREQYNKEKNLQELMY